MRRLSMVVKFYRTNVAPFTRAGNTMSMANMGGMRLGEYHEYGRDAIFIYCRCFSHFTCSSVSGTLTPLVLLMC